MPGQANEPPSASGSGDDKPGEEGASSSDDAWRRAAREITRLHNARHPGAPLAISGEVRRLVDQALLHTLGPTRLPRCAAVCLYQVLERAAAGVVLPVDSGL